MAFSNKHRLLLVTTVIYMLVFTSKFGQAYDEGGDEGQSDHDFPHQGAIDTDPVLILDKALECFNDKYIYSSCDEAHRLSQNGELKIGPEYTDEFCNGPCLRETRLVLDCIDGIFKHFVFYNKATLRDVRETIKCGCSYGPKRGDFNVEEHMEADDAIATKIPKLVYCSLLLMIMGWHFLF